MKFEYRGRFFSLLIVVTAGRTSSTIDMLEICRAVARPDHEMRRSVWKNTVEMIKSEPPSADSKK